MNLVEYQEKALRTESIVTEVVADKNELLHVLSIFVTAGEMLDCLKKKIYYKNPKKYNEKFQELSDSLKFFDTCADRHHGEQQEEPLIGIDPRVFHGIVGASTESAELAAALMKYITTGQLDGVNVQEEMADTSWYFAILNDSLDLSWEEGLVRNIAKLKARYPEKYSDESAEVRDLDTERKILEGKA
jgi:NTP pyrophosphatase (non-canonical NTP hydrolase)